MEHRPQPEKSSDAGSTNSAEQPKLDSAVFFEKVRQFRSNQDHAPHAAKTTLKQIAEWLEGSGNRDLREKLYPGWNDSDFREFLKTIETQTLDQKEGELDPLFVTFNNYRSQGGEIPQTHYEKTQRQKDVFLDLTTAEEEIKSMGIGSPDKDFIHVYAKIRAQFPDGKPGWIMPEAFICLGRM
jgi:hypothetical protein